MKLKHWKNILPGQDSLKKVTALTWSPNNSRLAVVTTDKIVTLYDENGEKRDKFSTKASDPKVRISFKSPPASLPYGTERIRNP